MRNWTQFLESKAETDTSKLNCVTDLAKAIQNVFKKYTRLTRQEAWKKITSKKGEELVQTLIHTPSRSLSPFKNLIP